MHFVNKLVFFSFLCTSNLAQMSENLYSNIFCFGNLETLQNLSRLRSTLRMKVNVKVICTSDVDVPISIFFLCLLYLTSNTKAWKISASWPGHFTEGPNDPRQSKFPLILNVASWHLDILVSWHPFQSVAFITFAPSRVRALGGTLLLHHLDWIDPNCINMSLPIEHFLRSMVTTSWSPNSTDL